MRALSNSPLPLLALRGGSLGGGGHALLSAVLASTPASMPAATPSAASTLASLLGYVIAAGSLLVYSPMLLQIWRSRSGEGLSFTSWAMSVFGFGGALVYQAAQGYPLSTYGELIALTAQSLAILSLMLVFDRGVRPSQVMAGLAVLGAAVAALVTSVPKGALKLLQAISGAILTLAIVPQVWENFATKTCGWSQFSALLSTGGNAIRVFTTLQLTKDWLVLCGFLGGLSLNVMLLVQTAIYPNPTSDTA